ncbi:hypothetical protein MKQ70_08215 [Chitinophaga sedimenti]|uniref:hypothetical protein n=1 Tax=Chitinophaga sedimenti TaxID=2033606 RepID=UPI002005662E|nr:hypothetical protein [Chitinophaga sedimenti]MCK7554990.1 hypothetical protein [Chitinophaga sedimenti]
MVDSLDSVTGFCVFLTVMCIVAAELFIHGGKKHYKSGVDTALMWMAGAFLLTGLAFQDLFEYPLRVSVAFLLIATVLALRYADVIMTGIAYFALLTFIFLQTDPSSVLRLYAYIPLAMVSAAFYFGARKLATLHGARHYRHCLTALEICALLSFYACFNYYTLAVTAVMGNPLLPDNIVPWFFWITTIILPLVYIFFGLKRKDRTLLLTGLMLVAAACYTIHMYHHLMALEGKLILAGALLAGTAWWGMRYLKTPKHGFTKEEDDDKHAAEKLHLESLIIVQTMQPGQAPDQQGFGGGSGVGGGATGTF